MKRMEVTEKIIGENSFYIKPFSAFTSANLSAELAATLAPILGSLGSLIGIIAEDNEDVMNMDITEAVPGLVTAISTLSGEKIEGMMMKLLVDKKNISVEGPETDGRTVLLTKDLADEIFCTELQDMYLLCFEVIRLNFGGFFKKLGLQFGNPTQETQTETRSTKNTAI